MHPSINYKNKTDSTYYKLNSYVNTLVKCGFTFDINNFTRVT